MANTVLWRNDEGYERARLASVWNELKPARFPAAIAEAETAGDVAGAVRLALEHGLRVKARSGGHSWTASSLRDDSLLVIVKALNEITVDPAAMTATVGPGVRSRELNTALALYGLFFPTGHAATVGLGGFLLQGGWGWNSCAVGPACMSVIGVDVVTAEGELVHADETVNTDLLWAARGAGPGFFGIVTMFYVRLYPLPASMMTTDAIFPLSQVDEVLTWVADIGPSLPTSLELTAMTITPRVDNLVVDGPPEVFMTAIAISDSEQDTVDALRLLETCPGFGEATVVRHLAPATMDSLYAQGSASEAPGYRYAVDNMWTSVGSAELVPELHDLFLSVPTVGSHAGMSPWPRFDLDGACLSVTGNLFVQAFTGWTDPADDERYENWGRDHLRRLGHLADGIQLADENLVRRPEARFLSDDAEARLEKLRGHWDPDGVFISYLLDKG